jgi:hypothetical protein
MANLKKRFHFTEWWMNALASTFGTILGIVLTVGITYWQQMENQKEMTRKIAKITLHNIDVRLNSITNSCEQLMMKDSVYAKLQSYMPDKLDELPEDSLNQCMNLLLYENFMAQDTKSEEIFSSSFEVWQFLDDEKVIGRISNCYSFLEMSEKLIIEIEQKLSQYSYKNTADIMAQYTEYDGYKVAKSYLKNPEVMAIYLKMNLIPLIYNMVDTVEKLNEKNKEVLGISQKELDNLSDLLEDDTKGIQYNIKKDSIQVTKDSIATE